MNGHWNRRHYSAMGAVVNPSSENVEAQIWKLKLKSETGISFIQTEAVFDPDSFKYFMGVV